MKTDAAKKRIPNCHQLFSDHYMCSLTSSCAQSTLPKFIDFFQNLCMKLWWWPHRVQGCWLKSTSPQGIFAKKLVPPAALGEGGSQMHLTTWLAYICCRISKSSRSLTLFESENLESLHDPETEGRQKKDTHWPFIWNPHSHAFYIHICKYMIYTILKYKNYIYNFIFDLLEYHYSSYYKHILAQ